jgi:hypothetical protein
MMLSREQMIRACLLVSVAGLLLLFFLSAQQNYIGVDGAVKLPAGSTVVSSGIVKSTSASGSRPYVEICQNACVKAFAQGDGARASVALVSAGDIVKVEGRTSMYAGTIQINAKKIEKVG